MSYALNFNAAMTTMVCSDCGIQYAAPAGFWDERRKDQKSWYCPNGHPRYYPAGESDTAKLQRRLEAAQADAEYQREESARKTRMLSAAKGRLTKVRNRIGNGICPCCNRTFQQLSRHMTTKHPDYKTREIG